MEASDHSQRGANVQSIASKSSNIDVISQSHHPSKHSSSTASLSSLDPTTVTFVDYRRPPSVQVQPPSKYKLWLLVLVLVYLAVWVAEGANLSQALRFRGWLSPDGAQFLQLSLVVFVLVYATLDFVVALGTVRYKGKEYGLGPWMKCDKRIQWIHQTRYSDNFFMECLKEIVHILEDGFGMFNATSPPTPCKSSRVKCPIRGRKTQDQSSTTENQGNGAEDGDGDNGFSYFDNNDQDTDEEFPYTCSSNTCKTVVKIEHRINPDRMVEYRQFEDRIQRAARLAHGLISIDKMEIVPEPIANAPSEKATDTVFAQSSVEDVEKGKDRDPKTGESGKEDPSFDRQLPTSLHSPDTERSTISNLHTVFLTFDNIDSLNDWMLSPRRKALMKQLEPLLAVPDHELIQAERAVNARDAFTNLTMQQGQSSPNLPPKKWKVWWLTTIALMITIRWSNSFLAYYLDFWGLDEKHQRLQSLVILFIVTFLNSYVTTPFLLFLFCPWLVRQPNEVDERFIWKTLDDGISSLWLKFLLTFAFYGGCTIASIV